MKRVLSLCVLALVAGGLAAQPQLPKPSNDKVWKKPVPAGWATDPIRTKGEEGEGEDHFVSVAEYQGVAEAARRWKGKTVVLRAVLAGINEDDERLKYCYRFGALYNFTKERGGELPPITYSPHAQVHVYFTENMKQLREPNARLHHYIQGRVTYNKDRNIIILEDAKLVD